MSHGSHGHGGNGPEGGAGKKGDGPFQYALVKGRISQPPKVVNLGTDHPHLQFIMNAEGRTFGAAVNVQSRDGSLVWYQVDHDFKPPQPEALLALSDGEKHLQDGDAHDPLALDFVREKLFNRDELIRLNPKLVADDPRNVLHNDLHDLVTQAFLDSTAQVYVFGRTFPGGVHEVHMNQLNPAGGGHDTENGTYRDGALFVYFPGRDQWFALFILFDQQLQAWRALDADGGVHARLVAAPLRESARMAFATAEARPRRRVGAGPISARNPFREAHRDQFAFRNDLLPKNPEPYTLDLSHFIPPEEIAAITAAKTLVFHTMGDTGNDGDSDFGQRQVASLMVAQRQTGSGASKPAFLYHLGDVIYPHGAEGSYGAQFYDIYEDYQAPILAVPGNHDGEEYLLPGKVESLQGFIDHFCGDVAAGNAVHLGTVRDKIDQPNPYWVLNTPLATLIGLYTNVDHVGTLDDPNDPKAPRTQENWLRARLVDADARKLPILLMLHHPVYTMDKYHGPSSSMKAILGRIFEETKIYPHAVFTAHVHNSQRFTEKVRTSPDVPPFDLPYLVAGAGGHGQDHKMAESLPPHSGSWWPNVTLESSEDRHKSFLRVTITDREIRGDLFRVPLEPEAAHGADYSRTPFDAFVLDLATRRLRVA